MFVQYFMTRDPITIGPEQTVAEAINLLNHYKFRHIPVVDDEGMLLGMLTDRNLRSATPSTVARSSQRQNVEEKVNNTPVKLVMNDDCLHLTRMSTLDRALLLLQSKGMGALPVLNETQQVIGVFSVMDLMKAYKGLFGLGEKGSSLVCIEDNGDPEALSKIVKAMEDNNVEFTRLIRAKAADGIDPMIYLRINTYNIRSVHKAIEKIGFTIHIPRVTNT
ncbi:CBS domain-containing protein [Desulfogranum japonicum]|uniref:CBS domain-containing protein n=1 Tax=Desulfogranum japonicum TaxID=231447 RepID=UPI000403BB01|nr:CBS domain-containing protein [Desulfogranum japonicum]